VVSALAGVTDALVALLPAFQKPDPSALRAGLTAIVDRHSGLAAELGLPGDVAEHIARESNALREPPSGKSGGELADWVIGHGELWSSRLVAAALQAAGLPAAGVDARTVIHTNQEFTEARPEAAGLRERAVAVFAPMLSAGQVPVTQGFIGATPDGRPTTLGRGGSDLSAALLAAALSASRVEIWTDVDGLMTADPRIVPEARVLPLASHLEAAELAAFGAKVLHPETQAPLVAARIPCVVLNSFAPDRPGTTLLSGARPAPVGSSPVRSISCKRGVTVINIRAPAQRESAGFLRALFEVMERHRAVVDVIATSEVNVSVTIADPARVDAIREGLERLGEVSVFPGRAIVAVVGIGLRGTKGLAGRIFTAVKGVNVEVISQGASEISVMFVVRDSDAPEAVRRLHQELIEAEPEPAPTGRNR
jgi:aspartate kinase